MAGYERGQIRQAVGEQGQVTAESEAASVISNRIGTRVEGLCLAVKLVLPFFNFKIFHEEFIAGWFII
jgi:hypothetical protein